KTQGRSAVAEGVPTLMTMIAVSGSGPVVLPSSAARLKPFGVSGNEQVMVEPRLLSGLGEFAPTPQLAVPAGSLGSTLKVGVPMTVRRESRTSVTTTPVAGPLPALWTVST